MKKTLKKVVTILTAMALALSLSVSSAAEESNVVVSEDGKVVTEYFDNFVLTLDETTAVAACEDNLVTRGTVCYTSIPSKYWGAYNASNGSYYLQISNGTKISFRGKSSTGREVFCHYNDLDTIYLYPANNDTANFSLTYEKYTSFEDGAKVQNSDMIIQGKFDVAARTVEIFSITYYYQ